MKTILKYTIVFGIGYLASFLLINKQDSNISTEYNHQIEIINTTLGALEAANIVMDNNELWDRDGSDEMELYLSLCAKVDSLVQE